MTSLVSGLAVDTDLVRLSLADQPTVFLEFEATISEQHSQSSIITDHPVESGADITDHIRSDPDRLRLDVAVSDFPLVFLRAARATPSVTGYGGDPNARAKEAFDFLERVRSRAELVSIDTVLKTYPLMAIESLEVRRDKDTGGFLRAEIGLRAIRVSQTDRVDAPSTAEPSEPARKTPADKGKQQAAATSAAEQGANRSVLRSTVDGWGSILGF